MYMYLLLAFVLSMVALVVALPYLIPMNGMCLFLFLKAYTRSLKGAAANC